MSNLLLNIGNWVLLSLIAGLVIGVFLLIYRAFNPDLSAKLRYQTALISVAALLFFTAVVPNISQVFSGMEQGDVNHNFNLETFNQFNNNDLSEEALQKTANSGKTSYFNIIQITVGIFWLVGIVIYTIKFFGGFIYLKMLLKNASSVIPQHWQEKTQVMKSHLKISQKLKLMTSEKVSSPLTFGWLRPIIVFPVGFFTTLPVDQIEAIILHELYHIKHKDYLLNILVMLMEIIFFYHPLMWYLSKEIQKERENTCDDAVIAQMSNPMPYAKALLGMEEFRHTKSHFSLHFSKESSQLNQRIMRLFSKKSVKTYSLKPFLALLFLIFSLTSFTLVSLNKNNHLFSNEMNTPIATEETEVQLKLSKNEGGFIILITNSAIYSESKTEICSLWLDDIELPANKSHLINYIDLEGMISTANDTEFRIYSKSYLSENGHQKLLAKNENDVIYRFHTKDGGYYTSEFNTWKGESQKNILGKNGKNDDETLKSRKSTVYGPSKLINQEKNKTTSLQELNSPPLDQLDKLKPETTKELIESSYKSLQYEFRQDTEKSQFRNKVEEQLLPDSTLIVLNGRVLGKGSSKVAGLDPNMIRSICVLKDAMAIEKYGEVAKNGVIEIYTKEDFSEKDLELLLKSFEEVPNEALLENTSTEGNQPLFFIDGIPSQQSNIKEINPNNIKKIEVLKGKEATKKHGKKAANGAIEIYLKKKE